MERSKQIVKISIQGILVNVFLVIFKIIIGALTKSIAIILDAVNNLSDALSSIITILGTALSNKRPDKKHPYGYGRIEYFSSVIIGIIVLLAGISSMRESILKVLNPTKAHYSSIAIIIIIASVLVKFFFGQYVKRRGEKLNSGSLVASGLDAVSDSFLSLSTLAAALISIFFHMDLEGYFGVLISLFIIKTSVEILRETIDDMIGTRADPEITKKLKKRILKYEDVLGVYDLTLHNYGPNKIIGTVHIQVKDSLDARDIHRITRKITMDVFNDYGIILTIGIYASNDSGEYGEILRYITNLTKKQNNILQVHGFYVDEKEKNISFDLIFSFDEKNPQKIIEEIVSELKKEYPKYTYNIILDTDFSDWKSFWVRCVFR